MDRKLSVQCKNPGCVTMISPVKRRNNAEGRSEYCSRLCYYNWSPGVEAVYRRILKIKGVKYAKMDPRVFMQIILLDTYKRFSTWTARAAVLNIKRQTFYRWIHHFKIQGFEGPMGDSKCE